MSEDKDKPVAYLSGQVSAAEEAPEGAGGGDTVEVYGTLGGEVAPEAARPNAGAPTQNVDADGRVVGMIGGQVQPPGAGAPTHEVSGMIGGEVRPPAASAAPVGELEGQTEAVEGYLPSSPGESVEGYLAPPSESLEGYLGEEPAPVDLGAQSYSDYDEYGASQPDEGYEDYEDGYDDSYANPNETATAEYEDSYEDSYGASSMGTMGPDESLMDDFDESLPQTISQQDAENIINRITRQKYDRPESQPRTATPKSRPQQRKSSAGIVIMLLLLVILGGGVAGYFLYFKELFTTQPIDNQPINPRQPIKVQTPDEIAEEVFRAGALASELNAFGVSESDLERGRGDTIPGGAK